MNSILKFFQVDSTGMFRMTSSARYLHIAPYGRTLQPQSLYQGPDRCVLEAYVPRLITCPSS
jgi:hypothetical protein